jgi:hypothetical protein
MTAVRLALRVAVLQGSFVGRAGLMLVAQPSAGIAAILANALTLAWALGQFYGIRSLRRRPPDTVVSLAGTCRSRWRSALSSVLAESGVIKDSGHGGIFPA